MLNDSGKSESNLPVWMALKLCLEMDDAAASETTASRR